MVWLFTVCVGVYQWKIASFFFSSLQVGKQWRGVEVRGGLSFGIRLRLAECNCPGCLCTPLIELSQTNWTPKLLSIESDEEVSAFVTFPAALKRKPLALPHTRCYAPRGRSTLNQYQGCCHWRVSTLTPQRAQHTKNTLSSRLKVLSALISYTAPCYGLDGWIPILVKHFVFSFLWETFGRGKKKKNPCNERFTYFFLSAFLTHYSEKETSVNVTVCY